MGYGPLSDSPAYWKRTRVFFAAFGTTWNGMPYFVPKSGCTGSSRPMARTIASDPGRTRSPSTRWFHGFEARKTMQPAIAAAASMPLSWHAPMRLLVTGGAGYIGSIVAQQMVARGDDVTVLDSLYKGH